MVADNCKRGCDWWRGIERQIHKLPDMDLYISSSSKLCLESNPYWWYILVDSRR